MTTPSDVSARPAPLSGHGRAFAPDLARGFMLLFIALANAGNWAFASGPGIDPNPDGWFTPIWNFFDLLLIDARAYPVFAVMFGYGLVQLAHRQEARGVDPRPVLIRRNAVLLLFGALHGTLLYFGDFLGAYGIVGLVATLLLLPRGDRFHRIVLLLWAVQLVSVVVFAVRGLLGSRGSAGFSNSPNPSLAAGSYLESAELRLGEWPIHTLTILPFVVIVWLGVWAARRGVLENPERHLRLLRWTAVGGIAIAVVGGLPNALIGAGLLHAAPGTVADLGLLSGVSGEYAGPGYVALFGLLAVRLRRSTPLVGAIAALGQRSLSGYLAQSVAFMILFAPFALNWGGSAGHAVVGAVMVWSVSVVGAARMQRRGQRGLAESLLRRLVYGRASTTSTERRSMSQSAAYRSRGL